MNQFILLLPHEPGRYEDLPEDDYMSIIADYVAWVEARSAEGVYKGGHKLTADRRVVVEAGNGGIEAHDSPLAEAAEVLGGLMVIEAKDFDAAVEIAKSHPHLVHNSRIEIRQIHEV